MLQQLTWCPWRQPPRGGTVAGTGHHRNALPFPPAPHTGLLAACHGSSATPWYMAGWVVNYTLLHGGCVPCF